MMFFCFIALQKALAVLCVTIISAQQLLLNPVCKDTAETDSELERPALIEKGCEKVPAGVQGNGPLARIHLSVGVFCHG